jgi:hypothetical protein
MGMTGTAFGCTGCRPLGLLLLPPPPPPLLLLQQCLLALLRPKHCCHTCSAQLRSHAYVSLIFPPWVEEFLWLTCVGTLQLLMHTEAQPDCSRYLQRSTSTPMPCPTCSSE